MLNHSMLGSDDSHSFEDDDLKLEREKKFNYFSIAT